MAQKQKMGQTLRDDFRQGGFFKNLKQEFKELEFFYLDDERRELLKNMGWFKRTFKSMIWLFKSLFFHLTTVRRILLVVAVVLFFSISAQINGNDVQIQRNGSIVSIFIFLFILMLELKDKLLAKNELRAGRAVQTALMPEQEPDFPGWQLFLFSRPANDVGGDLIDFFRIDDNEADITLCDVAGKGLPAALFAAKMQASLRAIAPDYSSIAKLSSKINEIFCRDGISSRFASLLFLRLEKDSGMVRMVNAGHLPPLLVQKQGIKELPKGDPAIGLKDKITYKELSVSINPGEFLLLYSDGLTEARDENETFYGDERLTALLKRRRSDSTAQIAREILHSVETFTGDAPKTDDLSFVILKRILE